MVRQNAKERFLKIKVKEKDAFDLPKKILLSRTLIGDCTLDLATEYMLLLLYDGRIEEMGRELGWY